MSPQEKWLGVGVALLGAAAIVALTLSPTPESTSALSPFCLFCGSRGAIDAILNVALFVPFGFGLRTAGFSRRSAIVASLVATVTIEILQVVVVPGRDASLGDVVWNSAGGALGALLAETWRRLLAPSPEGARRLVRVAAAVAAGAMVASAWMLQPSLPEGRWFAQWRPPDAQRGAPRARVLAAEWNGVPIPNGPLDADDELRARSRAEGLVVRAVVQPLEAGPWITPALAAADGERRSLWRVGVGERAIRFWARMRADDARFRSPGLLVPVASPDPSRQAHGPAAPAWRPGDTLHIRATRAPGGYGMEVAAHGRTARFAYRIAPTRGLLLVLPLDFAPSMPTDRLTLASLVLLFAPLGYWAGVAARARRARFEALALPLAVVVLTFWPLARLTGLTVPPAVEWAAALSGMALCAVLGVASTALRERRSRSRRGTALH